MTVIFKSLPVPKLSGNNFYRVFFSIVFLVHEDLLLLFSRLVVFYSLVKNLPAMQQSPVGFLGQEDPLEKG